VIYGLRIAPFSMTLNDLPGYLWIVLSSAIFRTAMQQSRGPCATAELNSCNTAYAGQKDGGQKSAITVSDNDER